MQINGRQAPIWNRNFVEDFHFDMLNCKLTWISMLIHLIGQIINKLANHIVAHAAQPYAIMQISRRKFAILKI